MAKFRDQSGRDAVSLYGKNAAAGDTPIKVDSSGNLQVGFDQTTPGTTNKVVADPVAASPTLYNLTLTNADTEYSQAMPANCRRFEFQVRTTYDARYAVVTGKVAGPTAPYATLKAGRWYDSGPIAQGASPSTLYFASATAGVVVEILAWT